MLFRRNFRIELETIPETSEEICLEIAKYCAENNLTLEFIKRSYPVIATIDGRKYEIRKQFTKISRINLWVLQCKEIK